MATSTIKFYKVNFPTETNCRIDDIEDFLGTLTPASFSDMQFIKHDLNIETKLTVGQAFVDNYDYNYVSIKNNSDNQIFYYFITKIEWVSAAVIKCLLSMDTVNSLIDPRNFTADTYINREHRDRYVETVGYTRSAAIQRLYNIVDKEAENFNVEQYKADDDKIELSANENLDWYVIYDGGNNSNEPIKTYLAANEDIIISQSEDYGIRSLRLEDFGDAGSGNGEYEFYFYSEENPDGFSFNGSFTAAVSQTYDGPSFNSYNLNDIVQSGWVSAFGHEYRYTKAATKFHFFKNNNRIYCVIYTLNPQEEEIGSGETKFAYKPSIFYTTSTINVSFSTSYRKVLASDTKNNTWDRAIKYGEYIRYLAGTRTTMTLPSISKLNRTSTTLSKLIKLPYCPINYTYDSNTNIFTFDSDWWISTDISDLGFLKYKLTQLPEFLRNNFYQLDIKSLMTTTVRDPKDTDDYNWLKEPKLNNSQFRMCKLNYDNFNYQIKPENINISNIYAIGNDCNVKLSFKTSANLSSKFLFKIDYSNFATNDTTDDYENYLLVNRNNEDVLYNSAYLSYLNNGYNYDKKSQSLQAQHENRQAIMEVAASTLNSTITAAQQGAMYDFAGMAKTGINEISKDFKLTENLHYNRQTRALQMQKNLALLQAQGTSVSGCDDLQLLDYYNGNRLRYITYKPSSKYQEEIAFVFARTGYAYNKHEVPEVDSRIWYNYIQCTPYFNYEGTKKYKLTWLNDLKQKYQSGVTVFHKRSANRYCLDRTKENYEKWILGE